MPSPHITRLLSVEQGIRQDLASARSPEEADCYRADLVTVSHSLWLSGYPGQAATDARVALVEIGLDKKRDSLSQGAFVARDNARPEARRSAGGEA